jgi:ABC-type dipeptide/oligopeptide/nickel transport system permease component
MIAYIVRRLLQSLVTLFFVTIVTFTFMSLSTDVAISIAPESRPEFIEQYKERMGLNDPIPVQYFRWLKNAMQGDFGLSFMAYQPALPLFLDRLSATAQLSLASLILALIISIPLGVLAAVKRGTKVDVAVQITAVSGQAMPIFWFGLILIIIFGLKLKLLPIFGYGSFNHLILPAVTEGFYLAPMYMRLTRSNMLDVLHEDYIRTARAKGLVERIVIVKHALKNAIAPIVAMLGMHLGVLFSGAIVVENVFAWPGVGRLAFKSINSGDFPVVQVIVVFLAGFIVLANLVADIILAYLDPRIRYT